MTDLNKKAIAAGKRVIARIRGGWTQGGAGFVFGDEGEPNKMCLAIALDAEKDVQVRHCLEAAIIAEIAPKEPSSVTVIDWNDRKGRTALQVVNLVQRAQRRLAA